MRLLSAVRIVTYCSMIAATGQPQGRLFRNLPVPILALARSMVPCRFPGVILSLSPRLMEMGEADIVTYPDGISTNRQLNSPLSPSSHVKVAVPVVAESNVKVLVQRSPSS